MSTRKSAQSNGKTLVSTNMLDQMFGQNTGWAKNALRKKGVRPYRETVANGKVSSRMWVKSEAVTALNEWLVERGQASLEGPDEPAVEQPASPPLVVDASPPQSVNPHEMAQAVEALTRAVSVLSEVNTTLYTMMGALTETIHSQLAQRPAQPEDPTMHVRVSALESALRELMRELGVPEPTV